jgi:hypothetical protein
MTGTGSTGGLVLSLPHSVHHSRFLNGLHNYQTFRGRPALHSLEGRRQQFDEFIDALWRPQNPTQFRRDLIEQGLDFLFARLAQKLTQ